MTALYADNKLIAYSSMDILPKPLTQCHCFEINWVPSLLLSAFTFTYISYPGTFPRYVPSLAHWYIKVAMPFLFKLHFWNHNFSLLAMNINATDIHPRE